MAASFPNWTPKQVNTFFNTYQSWEEKVKETYLATKRDEHFAYSTGQSLNLGNMLRTIPKRQRDRLLSEYRGLIGFDSHVSVADNPLFSPNINWLKKPGSKNPAGRLSIEESALRGRTANPQAVMLNNMFLQFDDVGKRFNFGSNIHTSSYARAIYNDSVSNKIASGKKILVWDTETTGLMNEAGIRQISGIFANTVSKPDGSVAIQVSKDMAYNTHFRTARMQWGYLADRGANTRQMNKVMEDLTGIKYANDVPGSGEDFANAIIPFLRELRDSHYIAGQNVGFDIDQIVIGLTKTAAYHQNPMLRDLLKEVRDSLAKPGKIRDTLAKSRSVLPNLRMAPELDWAGEVRTHSLENILLQTNLAKLIRQDVGGDAVFSEMFGIAGGGALHAADIDTRMTAYLMKFLYETDASGASPLKMERLGGDPTLKALRRMVLKSSAFTPITNLTDISHIDRQIFNNMVAETRAGSDSIRIMDDSINIHKLSTDQLWNILNSENAPFARFKMTPMEQEILKERAIIPSAQGVAAQDLIGSLGKWRNFAKPHQTNKGILNRMQDMFQRGIRPPKEQFDAMRRSMAEAGIPFAGLSQPERWMTHAMGLAGTRDSDLHEVLDGTIEGKIASISDDLGVTRWSAQKGVYVSERNISMPLELLKAAEADEAIGPVGTPERSLRVSAFETKEGRHRANLVHKLNSQEEAESLANWISEKGLKGDIGGKTLRDYGFDSENLKNLLEALRDHGHENGIAVGYLNRQAGSAAYEAISSMNSGLIMDDAGIRMGAALLPGELGYDADVIRTGPFRLDRMLGREEFSAERTGLGQIAEHLRGLEELAVKKPGFFAAASVMVGHEPNRFVQATLAATDVAMRHLPAAAGVSAALGLGYYIFKKRKHQEIYDQTMDRQPTETQSDYNNYRQQLDLPQAKLVRRRLDTLITAGLVGNADRSKIGHTTMGTANKYNSLFSGAYT